MEALVADGGNYFPKVVTGIAAARREGRAQPVHFQERESDVLIIDSDRSTDSSGLERFQCCTKPAGICTGIYGYCKGALTWIDSFDRFRTECEITDSAGHPVMMWTGVLIRHAPP